MANALKHLRQQFCEEFEALKLSAQQAVAQIRRWNQAPLCYTVGEEQLAACHTPFEDKDGGVSGDDAGAMRVLREVEAYIQVQSRVVVEASFKQILVELYVKGTELLHKVIKNSVKDIVSFIEDPQSIVEEREALRKRKAILESCIKTIKKI